MIQTSKSEADRTVTSFKNKFIRLFSTITNTNLQSEIIRSESSSWQPIEYLKCFTQKPQTSTSWWRKTENNNQMITKVRRIHPLFDCKCLSKSFKPIYLKGYWDISVRIEVWLTDPQRLNQKKGKENTKRCIKAAIFNVIQLTKNQKNVHRTPQKALISV